MAQNNGANQDFTNNSDGYTLGGGTTERKLTVTGADMTLTGSGTNVFTFPGATDTLVGRASIDTLTNKTMAANGSATMTLNGNPVWQYLGYVQVTSNQTSTTTGSWQNITSLSVTVTVPSGATKVRITLYSFGVTTSSAGYINFGIWNGNVSGTQYGQYNNYVATASQAYAMNCVAVIPASAGSATFSGGFLFGAGTLTMNATSTLPTYILVECC